ncbi:hypothetical protein GCM10022217_02380 [Chryseobacterium ginsenosidimutans]
MMKNIAYLILSIFLFGCQNKPEEKISKKPEIKQSEINYQRTENDVDNEICWEGQIMNKIPIFIHYSLQENLVTGEIIYLNTSTKTPIKLIGTIEDDKSFRLLEFDKNGNITGIITGKPNGGRFNGKWFSPISRKEFSLNLNKSEKHIKSESKTVNPKDIFGDYRYSYGEFTYNGKFNVKKIDNNLIAFEILSVGNGEAPPIAQVERDTIKLESNNSFTYKLPESNDCEL